MGVRFYTPEIDAMVRAAFELPPRSPERREATVTLSRTLGRSVDALNSRYLILCYRRGRGLGPTPRRSFSAEEDAAVAAVPDHSSVARWQELAERFGRSVGALRHRRRRLREEGVAVAPDEAAARRPDRLVRFRVQLPVAQPSWFENPITRGRLMAGR